ncbi:MAG: hypothetical protein K8R35_09425, partial [Bacteroidales bacterium]|nr:hypothetical protein [Bacteroidales bacterium]
MPRALFITVLLIILPLSVRSQVVSHPVKNSGIYDFLDQLANNHVIDINSVVKPWSRIFISQKLKEADENREALNPRQQKELDFYMMDFGKELNEGKDWDRRKDMFYYKDDLFTLTVNPILGGEVFTNSDGKATYCRNGAEAWSYIGNLSVWGSLRDNHEKPLLGRAEYLTQREGGHIKVGTDWSEMQGGVAYDWKWGSVELVKDYLQWGNNYNGANIFGGHTPSFFQYKLHIKPTEWFDFNYMHGWLNSMVIDSTRSYWVTNSYGTDYREVYHKKFI